MLGSALSQRLHTFQDGLTTFRDGERIPVPLVATEIVLQLLDGLALIRTFRTFRNGETAPIEAILTFPVGFDAVVTELVATVDGRRLVAQARGRESAREKYEVALDEGKLSVLHEEALRGIHVLSVGALPPGATIDVELEQVVPFASAGGEPFLRLPVTVGQLYGASPLLPADDLVTSDEVRHAAKLRIVGDRGSVIFEGRRLQSGSSLDLLLDQAIELRIEEPPFGTIAGQSADGRQVAVSISPAAITEGAIDLHILVDHSGSTSALAEVGGRSVWEAMRAGLNTELAALQEEDHVNLWQFDDKCDHLGEALGRRAAKLVPKLQPPAGGTELGGAVGAALLRGARDILVLTDGQTWAHVVEGHKDRGARISAILVGRGSLDANIGHLCAMTGGQLFYAPGADVAASLRSALQALRSRAKPVEGHLAKGNPEALTVQRGGTTIRAVWRATEANGDEALSPAIGRFAAALALPLQSADQALGWAMQHGLCTHLTSLVLVDHEGSVVSELSRQRKVPLMASSSGVLINRMPVPEGLLRLSVSNASASSASYRASENRSMCEIPGRWYPNKRPSGAKKRPTVPTRHDGESVLSSILGLWSRLMRGRDRSNNTTAQTEFMGLAWDVWGNDLLAGKLDCLTLAQRQALDGLVERISRAPSWAFVPVQDKAKLPIWALGLIAKQSGDRLAIRCAKRALRDAPDWLVTGFTA